MKWELIAGALLLSACASHDVQLPAPDPRLNSFFPSNYDQSVATFRQSCATLSGQTGPQGRGVCQSFPVPGTTPGELPLTIDSAFFAGGKGNRLLIVQSGIHGVEAPAGAAAQALLMREFLRPFLDRQIDVLLIHALDPWGFRHSRRTDQANVNLNRNFSLTADLYDDRTSTYGNYRSIFEPSGNVPWPWQGFLGISLDFLVAIAGDGFETRPIDLAFNQGQYEFPDGLNFGGHGPAIQVDYYLTHIKPIIDQPQYGKVLVLDFHTGLGDNAVLSIIKGKHPAQPLFTQFIASLNAPDNCTVTTDQGIAIRGPDCPDNFATDGDVIDFIPLLAPETPVLAVTAEYGTLGTDSWHQLDSVSRMILENQAHGGEDRCANPETCAAVRNDFRELFNPSDPAWQSQVMREAAFVFSRILADF